MTSQSEIRNPESISGTRPPYSLQVLVLDSELRILVTAPNCSAAIQIGSMIPESVYLVECKPGYPTKRKRAD